MLNRCLRAPLILLLILGQSFAVLHAAELGTEDHSHDCIICIANPTEEEHDIVLPSPGGFPGFNFASDHRSTVASTATIAANRIVWPQPTGPPYGA